jgi:hypothetical protein
MVVVIAFRISRKFAHPRARPLKCSLRALQVRPDGVVAWVVSIDAAKAALERWFAF